MILYAWKNCEIWTLFIQHTQTHVQKCNKTNSTHRKLKIKVKLHATNPYRKINTPMKNTELHIKIATEVRLNAVQKIYIDIEE